MAIELEDYAENEDYQVRNDTEPYIRSQNIIFFSDGFRWHINVTFKGNTITRDVDKTFIKAQEKYLIRRQQLRAFILFIKFDCLPLLEDTAPRLNLGPFRLLPEDYH